MSRSFLEDLARPRPNPGGGAAAAYGASVGLALVEKVCLIESRRLSHDTRAAKSWNKIHIMIVVTSKTLTELRDADSQAYEELATVKNRGGKGEELFQAVVKAVEIPKQIVDASVVALKCASDTGKACKKHLVSDIQVSCQLIIAAVRAAYHIAVANVRLVGRPSGTIAAAR